MADRKDFYFRQKMTQAELDASNNDLELADRNIVKDVMGFGFLIGAVYPGTVLPSATVLKVLVNPLLGYDQTGRRLENTRSGFQGGIDLGPASPTQDVDLAVDENAVNTAVAAPGNEKTISIFIEFERKQFDPRTDGNSNTVNFEQQESIKFNIVQSAEAPLGTSVPAPLRTDQLLLADVTLVFGQTLFTAPDIDQSRRQAFALTLIHGGSHVEGGFDPIPNATPVALTGGGLMSGSDKIKLDGITFTNSGVGALFQKFFALFNPANIVAPGAVSLDVSTQLSGKSAGGSSSTEGVVTQSGNPDNIAHLQTVGGDSFLDAQGNKVFGRITVNNEVTPTVWTLSFFTINDAGVENAFDMTPNLGQTIVWYVTEAFSLENVPSDGFINIPSDQLAGKVVDATETQKGIVELASDGETAAGVVVQGNDTRLANAFPEDTYQAEASVVPPAFFGTGIFIFLNNVQTTGLASITQDGSGTFTFPNAGRYRVKIDMNYASSAGTGDAQTEIRQPHSATLALGDPNAVAGGEGAGIGGVRGPCGCSKIIDVTAGQTMNVFGRLFNANFDTSNKRGRIEIERIR